MAEKKGTDVNLFLAACFKSIEGEPKIDWANVATLTGMSAGGARNKFSAWRKDNGLVSPEKSAKPTKPKAAPKKAAAKKSKKDVSDSDEGDPPSKKAKVESVAKEEDNSDDEDIKAV